MFRRIIVYKIYDYIKLNEYLIVLSSILDLFSSKLYIAARVTLRNTVSYCVYSTLGSPNTRV